jgi:hypothetical protein
MPRRVSTLALAAVALAACLALAACGGSSSKKATTPPAPTGLTKAQYIAQADPICAAAKRRAPTKRILALIGQFPTPTKEIARLLRKTAVIVKEVTAQLNALQPPSADRAAIARWIAQGAAIGPLLTKAAGQVSRGDLVAAIGSQQDINAATVEPTTFAKSYGLRDCATIGA